MLSSVLVIISILTLISLFVYSLMRSWRVLFFGSCLLLFGIWALFSVSIHESFTTTLKLVNNWVLWQTSNYYYFFQQIDKLLLWLVVSLVTYFIPRTFIKKFKVLIFVITLLSMWLLWTPLATDLEKWVTLRVDLWFITIQPWEFFKLGLMFFLPYRLIKKRRLFQEHALFLIYWGILWLCLLVFAIISDWGSILILWPAAFLIYRYITGQTKHIWIVFLVGIISTFTVAQIVTSDKMKSMDSNSKSYVQKRLEYYFTSSENNNVKDREGVWRQWNQALIAVWWGWWIGKWYGKWLQKFGYIPEAQSDFIFSAFAEEIWFIGNFILLTFYFLLARHSIKWLRGVHDEYDRGMLVALISLIIVQMFINIWVNIKLVPLTGITLPFVSHGWSALIINMIEVVLIHKIIYRK